MNLPHDKPMNHRTIGDQFNQPQGPDPSGFHRSHDAAQRRCLQWAACLGAEPCRAEDVGCFFNDFSHQKVGD